MFLILAFLLGAVLWGFFHANPRGVSRGWLLACNAALIAAGVAAGATSGLLLHADALAKHPDQQALAIYLASMAGGSAFMIIVAAGGLIRNLVLFPLSRRRAG